jgi:hypothetical protein
MIGGTSAPPELAAASIPAACSGLKPAERMSGIVNVPVVAVLATALPEREDGSEEDEKEHVGEHDAHCDAKDALGLKDGLADDAVPPVSSVWEQPTGHVWTPGCVSDKDKCEYRERVADCASGRLKDDEQCDQPDQKIERRFQSRAFTKGTSV